MRESAAPGCMIHGMQHAAAQSPIIRDAHRGDIQRLFDIDQLCFPSHIAYSIVEMRSFLRHPMSIAKVAESGATIVGFAVGQLSDGLQARIITLDVIPEARRKRIGSSLMDALHGEFRDRGVQTVVLEVATDNEAALRLYFLFGYRRGGLLPDYYGQGSDAYRLIMKL